MKEKHILFSAPMVRALLAGTKTQTRRVVKPKPPSGAVSFGTYYHPDPRPHFWAFDGDALMDFAVPCPYGQPGDRLLVKEAAWMWCERRPNGKTKTGRDKWLYVPLREAPIHYAADHPAKPSISVVSPDTGNQWGWRLKIGRFLPAWASRITLEVTGVRVERLKDISEADAIAEGIELSHVDSLNRRRWKMYPHTDGKPGPDGEVVTYCGSRYTGNPIESYKSLWLSINGPGSWDANPWVWVVEFKKVKA